jgi:hypothetical protein
MRTTQFRFWGWAVGVTLALSAVSAAGPGPRFLAGDPLTREPESQDASKAQASEIGDMYEMVYNLFVQPGYKASGRRAQNVNTVDEVPDSSWFTNRVGTTAIPLERLVRGPLVGAPPDPSQWVIIREKTSGVHPGVTARDAKGETWFLEFDPPYYPEAATAAVVIATKFFWALGYNQVESFISTFDPAHVTFDPKATLRRPNGKRTPFNHDDLDSILERVARRPDGTYRVVAGRLLPGTVLGNFRYEGTRPDDPNDLVPHQHRRELRALRVFGAWTNLTDLKAANTLDTLDRQGGRAVVKHWLQDVGSTFGMNNDLHEWDLSWENFYQAGTTVKRLASFGFALSPWQTVRYVEGPSIGKFEGDRFDPRAWRPQTLTTAFMELRADDAFWAARRVAAFTDDMIRALVDTGELSDRQAASVLAGIMMKRRDAILRAYLPAVNPVVSPQLDADGRLTFRNAAVDAGVAKPPDRYRVSWFAFDNAADTTSPLSESTSTTTSSMAPAGLDGAANRFVAVDIAAESADHPSWRRPVRAYFRRSGTGWTLVGLTRLGDVEKES